MAAIRRFSLPLEPLADRDVWGYLSPGLLKILGHPFIQSEGRGFVYPGFVYLTLRAFGNLNAVTLIQHLFGLGAGLLLLANWTAARRLLPNPRLPRVFYDVLGLGMLATYLFSAQSILAEHHLRSEGILPFFSLLGFGCIIQFFLAWRIDKNPSRAAWFGAASLLIAFLLPLFKPSFALTSVLTTLPIWWQLFDRREKWVRRLAMVGGPVFTALVLLWIPEYRYAEANPRGRIFLPASLFTIHARQIRAQIASDLATNPAGLPYSHEQLQAILTLLDAEMAVSQQIVRHNFASLGFDADYLLYEDSFCRKLQGILPLREARSDFYRFYFRRTWSEQPGAMLRKIVAQLGLFYNFDCPVYLEKSTRFDRSYNETYAFLSEPNRLVTMARVPLAVDYLNSLPALAQIHVSAVQPTTLKLLMPLLGGSYLPIFLLSGVVLVWLLVAPQLRAACGWLGAVVAIGYGYNLGNNLAIACFHTLGIGRYSHVQLGTTLLTQGLALYLFLEIALWWRLRRAATSALK